MTKKLRAIATDALAKRIAMSIVVMSQRLPMTEEDVVEILADATDVAREAILEVL